MITDAEIQVIFDWADENKLNGKRVATTKYEWGTNVDSQSFEEDWFKNIRNGIPREKELLRKITHLNLEANKLKDIPKELGKLTNLQHINLDKNYLNLLPEEFFNLINLKTLSLSDNEFSNISEKIKNLIELKTLDLSYCISLKKIPSEIGQLKQLQSLDLDSCEKLQFLPKEIGKLQNLKKLTIESCFSLKELPRELFKLSQFNSLSLEDCSNLESLPKEIGTLTRLKKLILHGCQSLKTFPEEMSNLTSLEYLDLSSCDLNEVPFVIGNITNLNHLKITSNDSLSSIPENFTNLKNLNILEIDIHDEYNGVYHEKLKEEILDFTGMKFFEFEYDTTVFLRQCEQKSFSNIEELDTQGKKLFSNQEFGISTFPHKNILLKGVPGTGKSRAIENIINNKLELKDHKENILRINIHSASSNADLMQGIGISSSEGKIEYKEKQGLILDIIQRATFKPNQPFVLILEEIQENSLNELIGDLIYLIEEDKRAKNVVADGEAYAYQELVEKIIEDAPSTDYVEIPYLVNNSTEYRKMIMPNNLYIFCTSNYRDDKKVIEDNLLRRFEVLEVYPKEGVAHEYCRKFFKALNENILTVLKDEIHPDRFLIGHAIWKDVSDKLKFYRAFLKVVVEFKDIKEVEFDEFKKIVKELPMLEELDLSSYKALIEDLQNKAGYDFLD